MSRVLLAGALVLCLLRSATGRAADFFRWVDEKGVIHFTDNLHNIPEKFRATMQRIPAKDALQGQQPARGEPVKKVSIPIQKKGEVVIVPATINERIQVNFVVDTGASYTMISRAVAQNLRIDLEKKHPMVSLQTANGVIEAPLVAIDSIEVGGLQVRNLSAAVYDVFADPNISGLLGLNYLTHFRMDIDTQASILVLERK
jgi:clan AA aspartic protease (TIGR02281 family)